MSPLAPRKARRQPAGANQPTSRVTPAPRGHPGPSRQASDAPGS
jgi:hypothetical protein